LIKNKKLLEKRAAAGTSVKKMNSILEGVLGEFFDAFDTDGNGTLDR
jgi:hypothetical protein